MRSAAPTLSVLATLGAIALAGDAVAGDERAIIEAERFYDGLADGTKRSVYDQVAGACDPARDGTLDRPMDPPERFGALRLYPRGYRMAKRVAGLPLDDQQRIYAYVYDHQVRSGWVRPSRQEGDGGVQATSTVPASAGP